MAPTRHLVVMGVAGCGKSTVGQMLADGLGWPFAEADAFHPPANIAKMSAGGALTDEDRWPWLEAIRDWIAARDAQGTSTVVACSALRRAYRDVLREAGQVTFVHLDGRTELIGTRLERRPHHFMPASLLPSQVHTLEPLDEGEDGVSVPIDDAPDAIARAVLDALGLQPDTGRPVE